MRGQVVAALEGMNNLKEFVSDVTGYMCLDYLKNISLKHTNKQINSNYRKRYGQPFFQMGFFKN